MNRKILAIDIGGTNTRLALFDIGQDPLNPAAIVRYKSRDFDTFDHLFDKCRQEHKEFGEGLIAACFGVAGTVKNNVCHTTNLPWVLEGDRLKKNLAVQEVFILNDLQAAAYGILAMPEEAFQTLQKGREESRGNKALIGAGTGLGEAAILWTGERYQASPSEGGHADYAPKDKKECDLLLFLTKELGRVSVENVVSGPGLWNIYRFLRDQKGEKNPPFIQEHLSHEEKGSLVSQGALIHKNPLCSEAVDIFLKSYAGEAGNLALRFLTYGGLYIGGGIAPKMDSLFQTKEFLGTFRDKGVMARLVGDVPIKLILDDRAPLFGCAFYLKQCL